LAAIPKEVADMEFISFAAFIVLVVAWLALPGSRKVEMVVPEAKAA
jgi:hypothetical protein